MASNCGVSCGPLHARGKRRASKVYGPAPMPISSHPSRRASSQLEWLIFWRCVGSRFEGHCRQALADRVTIESQAFHTPLQTWLEVHAYPSARGLSMAFQDVTAWALLVIVLLRHKRAHLAGLGIEAAALQTRQIPAIDMNLHCGPVAGVIHLMDLVHPGNEQ